MGVSHLGKHAAHARSLQNNGGAPDSRQVSSPMSSRPAPTSGANVAPRVAGVASESKQALRPGMAPSQPPKGNQNGSRAGAKSGHGKLGGSGGAPGMTGGRLG